MPYLPLLYKCLNVSNAPGIVVLAMRSLSLIFSVTFYLFILNFDSPIEKKQIYVFKKNQIL